MERSYFDSRRRWLLKKLPTASLFIALRYRIEFLRQLPTLGEIFYAEFSYKVGVKEGILILPSGGACLTVWTEGGVTVGGWGRRPPSVETLAEMTVLKRNNGLGNKLDPKEEEKVEFGAEL